MNTRYRSNRKHLSKAKRCAKYKISVREYDLLWETQRGRCEICDVVLMDSGQSSDAAVVDHDHDSGRVRAILCMSCNHALGAFREDADNLQQAIIYLCKFQHPSATFSRIPALGDQLLTETEVKA